MNQKFHLKDCWVGENDCSLNKGWYKYFLIFSRILRKVIESVKFIILFVYLF